MKKNIMIFLLLLIVLQGFSQNLYIYKQHDKYGLVDENGIVKLAIQHDRISDLKESDWSNTSAFLVEKGKKNGLMDYEGNWIYPLIYDQILCQNGNCRLKKNDLFGYGNVKGKVFIPEKYQNLGVLREGKIRATLKVKSGYLNTKNKWVIEPKFDPFTVEVGDFYDGRAKICSEKTKKCGYIDEKGKILIPQIYNNSSGDFYDGLAAVRIKNKQCYIDKNGKVAISLDINYSYGMDFEHGVVELSTDCIEYDDYRDCDRYLFNTQGENILPKNCIVEHSHVRDNYTVVIDTITNLEGVIDNQGKVIVPIKHTDIGTFDNELDWIKVTQKKKSGIKLEGFYNRQGKIIVDCLYYTCNPTLDKEYIFFLYRNGTTNRGLLDKNGKEIFPPIYREIDFADDDVFVVYTKDYLYGYYNLDGSVLIAPKYRTASDFVNGLAVVQDKNGWKIINKKNEVLHNLGYQYIEVTRFSNNRAIVTVKKNGKTKHGLINTDGKLVVPPIYDYMYHYNDIIVVESKPSEKYGIIDPNGKIIIPLEYDKVAYSSCNGKFYAEKKDKKYWFDLKGNPLSDKVPIQQCKSYY